MRGKKIKLITLALAVAVTFSVMTGCSSSKKVGDAEKNNYWTAVKAKPEQPINNTDKVFRYVEGFPKPPLYQGNVFASGGVGYNAEKAMFEGLFQFVRSTDEVIPRLAESYETVEDKTTIKLIKNAKWHDGTPFTSKDIWAYYMLNNGGDIPKKLDSIEIPDDYTVVFDWNETAPYDDLKIMMLAQERQGTIPYHIYSKYVDKCVELFGKAKKATDSKLAPVFGYEITPELREEFDANWQEFVKCNPKTPVGTGPYKFSKVTETELHLVKNEEYWDAENVNFEKLEFVQVPDISSQYAMLKSGKLDSFATTPPVDILQSMLDGNEDLIHYKMNDPVSTGIHFNSRREPFNDPKFRQAIVYAIDRTSIREFANYYGVEYSKYSTLGILPSIIDEWVDKDTQGKMTDYTTNTQKAEELLKEIGWTRGSDGVWVDKNGKKAEFVIGAAAGWIEVVNYSQAVAEQLTAFGLPTKVLAQDGSIYWTNAGKDEYDMVTDWTDNSWSWREPSGTLKQMTYILKTYVGVPVDEETGKLKLELPTSDGKTVQYEDYVDKLLQTEDINKRKAMVSDMVKFLNENAYSMGIYQNTTGIFLNTKNVEGVLPIADKIEEYKRNMPLPTSKEDQEALARLNLGFGGSISLSDGDYWPR